ncbi:MAG: response regulator [Acidobacteria bacterium]|nr:response regulator [Acidobacteriota bacterium]
MERAEFEQWKPKEVARLLALVETERRYYQEIVASIPVSLLIVGSNLHAVSANRQFRMRVGKKNDEILGRPLLDLLPIDGLQEVAEQVVNSGIATPKREMNWGGQDVVVTAMPLRSWEEDSESEALLVIEEKAAQVASLTARDQKALSVAASIEGMLWEVDYAAGGITHVSAGAEELFGYPVERWLSDESVWGLRVAEGERARVDEFYDGIGSSAGTVFSIEFLARHADGQEFLARETVRVARDESGKPLRLAGLTTNVSERRELESQQSLALKGEALQRLSAKLAHDLNNLLMIVAGYGEEMKNSLPAEHTLHQDMKEILGATERLYSLTTQFQTYTRRPVVTPRITSLAALVSQARTQIEAALGPELALEIHLPAGLAKAKIDGAQIEDALVALARHASLAMHGAGILKLSAENVLRSEAISSAQGLNLGAYLRMTLEGAGAAMWGERLLEPWLAAEGQPREVELGVAAAYQIVRQSHGDLSVDGAKLHLYLPMVSEAELEAERALAAAQVVAPPPPVEVAAEPETTLESILVVEDEGGIRALVRKILRRQGYQVIEASNGEEALRLLAEAGTKVDLLLTDVMMPGMNGVELSQKALLQDASLKVLFVSGYTDESVLEAGQFPAGTAFLQKPFTLGSLLGKVREVLDGAAARQAAS